MELRKGDVCFSVLLLILVFLSIALIILSDPDNYFYLSGLESWNKRPGYADKGNQHEGGNISHASPHIPQHQDNAIFFSTETPNKSIFISTIICFHTPL